jgi:hypothetical protein
MEARGVRYSMMSRAETLGDGARDVSASYGALPSVRQQHANGIVL